MRETLAATVARHAALEAAERAARKEADGLTERLAALARRPNGSSSFGQIRRRRSLGG
ncbi:hypothetical protein [Azospirillum sp. INR13]|uniref:hypothetical protein n=1 Tax=Azospirillum sp. INR13 TaxID=2596919 RepID=UPI0018922314|nr:hypothetical protein [Azospirillum sp. INR13]